jgi:hypothetical protein
VTRSIRKVLLWTGGIAAALWIFIELRIGEWGLWLMMGLAWMVSWIPYYFPDTTELARIASADRKLDAVLIRINAPVPMASTSFDIYIVRAGTRPAKSDLILEGGDLEQSKMSWVAPGLLQIDYAGSCINQFRNWWCTHDRAGVYNCEGDRVEVRLLAPRDNQRHECKSD